MKNGKYLSDVLDTSLFNLGTMNIIVAPCGCGKTTAAINRIAALASSPHKALFLIDTHNGNVRLAKNEALTMPYVFFPECVCNPHFPSDELQKEKIVVTTYAQFGVWVKHNPAFADFFEVIICDEAHNISIFPNYGPQPNFGSFARDALCAAVARTLVVGMTATPEPLEKLACAQYVVPVDASQLRQYENREVRSYASLPQVLEQIPHGKIGMLYVPHITQMKECAAIASAAGHKPICVWSLTNTDHPMTEEQLAARQYILKHEELPPQYDLFIFNGSCETSINIRGHIDYFIAHTANLTSLTQARGRYRGDLDLLYVYDKEKGEIIVPEEFLDIQLFTDNKRELRARLGLKDEKGHPIPYGKLEVRLKDCGYTIESGRKDNSRFIIIRKE